MENQFSINAKTCTLRCNSQTNGSVILDNKSKYLIPIYQRPYSWSENEINKLISDIFISYWGNDGNNDSKVEEPMFIGTMQLSAKKGNEQEVIDGQQRLTTLLLMIKFLQETYSDNQDLKDVTTDWLKTEVNSGEQQKSLEQALRNEGDESQNRYLQNIKIIKNKFNEIIEDKEFDADNFIKYLLSNLYFVVIETNAGLSKTLQIFNAINTTGLDLNGGDLFKIRMYEYLVNNKEDKSIFDEISKLYQKIEQKNKEIGSQINIQTILSTYQYIIVAKYNLPTTLYYLGVDTFYDRLFDTILNVQQWDNFKNNVSNVKLSLDDLDKIIDIRFDWERQWRNLEGFTAEDVCSVHFLWWSRYSRYWNLIFVFLYAHKEDENNWGNMLFFIRQLNKLYFIYSVRYQKLKSEIYYHLSQEIIKSIVNHSFDETIKIINNAIGNLQKHSGNYDLNWHLSENLTENAKRKNLVCRLSAMLEEDYKNSEKTKEIKDKLFAKPIDIEHIQSYLDSNKTERKEILEKWGRDINSIGNLMVLEQHINRSISNSEYKIKTSFNRANNKPSYQNSNFQIVKNQIKNYPEWSLEKAQDRKVKEKEKLVKYLFEI
ncbi:MAG TPA: DUF262 domain-containing HNH endonuclease family protein [Crocinitomicaceae bacterium]|nr:DUF262 domain-containing HNH endonuclease family protein [Crocinitomicaceae bacterium]